jgi:sugar phosphate isomerase/epimerase
MKKEIQIGIDAASSSISFAREHGVKGVPISSKLIEKDGAGKAAAPIREAGLEVCQINAMGYNPLHPDVELRKEQGERVLRVLSETEELGCPYVSINGGNYHPSGFLHGDLRNFGDAALEEISRELEPLLSEAEKRDAFITLEPYVKGVIYSAERYLALEQLLGERAGRMRINLDVSSLYDLHALIDPEPFCEDLCTTLTGKIGLIHVKDIKLEEGFHIHANLAPITEGPTNWEQLLRLSLPELPDDSWLILEHVQSSEEAGKSLSLIRSIVSGLGYLP